MSAPIKSVVVRTATASWPIEFHKVDLEACPQCGALDWFLDEEWESKGMIRCPGCGYRVGWREVTRP